MGQREKERRRKKQRERRGDERDHKRGRKRANDGNQREGEKVSVDNEGEAETDRRGERWQWCSHTALPYTEGDVLLQEVVLLSQMTSASLLKTIG